VTFDKFSLKMQLTVTITKSKMHQAFVKYFFNP